MVYLWTRATLNWADEAVFWEQLPAELHRPVKHWNASFRLPYHLFRHRLRQIALANHATVEGAISADWDDIPEGGLVVPVDDDDWLAPDLGELLGRAFAPEWEAYLWHPTFLEIPTTLRNGLGKAKRKLLPSTPRNYIFYTNNYAMQKSAETKPLLRGHTEADAWFKSGREKTVLQLTETASVMNRTLGSTTVLCHKGDRLGGMKLRLKAKGYERLYRRPPAVAWAAPYQEAMGELMHEL